MKNTKSTDQANELLSALVDGQLENEDLVQALDVCAHDSQAMEKWNAYCLIGDTLRSPELAQAGDAEAFLHKLRGRLVEEPDAPVLSASSLERVSGNAAAANEADFRWRLAVGFASVAAVAVISWGTMTHWMLPNSGGTAQQMVVASEQGAMMRDAKLEELLAAHRQLGGGSVVPADFMHNVVFDDQQRAKR